MSVALFDVNVLVALVWPAHESHNKVQNWFQQRAKGGWATCPVTQAALVRIVSNPAFSSNAVSANDAISLLTELSQLGTYEPVKCFGIRRGQ